MIQQCGCCAGLGSISGARGGILRNCATLDLTVFELDVCVLRNLREQLPIRDGAAAGQDVLLCSIVALKRRLDESLRNLSW